jgi:regulatory protein
VTSKYNRSVADAYIVGLTLLARRELSEAQLRARLARRKFDEEAIETAVARLRREGALDDRRTAIACARTEAHVKRHGRLRAVRAVEALGIARSLARTAVAEAFADLDEDTLLVQAIERRLRHETGIPTPAAVRRLHRYLLTQGFDAARVTAAIRNRFKTVMYDD